MRRPVLVVGAEAATPLYTLSTATQLRNQPSDPRTARVRTLGRASVNDGYAADYVFDESSQLSDDGYDVLAPTDLARGRWLRVRDADAAGSARVRYSDSYASLQAALDALEDGETLVITGEHALTRQEGQEYALKLSGRDGVTLRGENATLSFTGDVTSAQFISLFLSGCRNATVTGLKMTASITGDPVTRRNSYLIFAASLAGVGFENFTVEGCAFTIQHELGSSDIRGVYGIYYYGQNGYGRLNKGLRVINNTFDSCEGRHVQTWNAEDVLVQGNRFINCGPIRACNVVRMVGGPKDVRIIGNHIELSAAGSDGAYGINLGSGGDPDPLFVSRPAENVVIEGNTIVCPRGSATDASVGVYLMSCRDVLVRGNVIVQDSPVAFGGYGVRIQKDGTDAPSRIRLEGNVIRGWNVAQIFNNTSEASDITVSGNRFGPSSADGLARGLNDSHGILRALDNESEGGGVLPFRLEGTSSPEGSVSAPLGSTFLNVTTGQVFVKRGEPTATTGWGRESATISRAPEDGGTIPSTWDRRVVSVVGAAAPVTLSATTAIEAGFFVGQELLLVGTSDTNTITVPKLAGVRLGSACTLGVHDTLSLVWNGAAWIETGRTNYS